MGAGAFVVFAVLMRLVLYPRMKKGMDARYASIRAGHEDADALRQSARAEVAEYETQLAGVRAEAAARVDAARQTLDGERQARLAEANARIGERRAAAIAQADAVRERLAPRSRRRSSIVASGIVELATGKRPDSSLISTAASAAMTAGVAR